MTAFEIIDDWGPEKVVVVSDRRSGMKGVLVLDNTARGMGKGGTRMSPTLTVREVARLARTMTWKWAAADLYFGGAKAGILGDPKGTDKERILRAFARALRNEVPSEYYFGLDMGLVETDAAIFYDELGGSGAVGLPRSLGGLPYDQLGFTGYGLVHSSVAVMQHRGVDFPGTRVAIQGLGAVGVAAARRVEELGGVVVAVSTARGAIERPDGLDVPRLIDLQQHVGDACVEQFGLPVLPLGTELTVECDVLMVCARQDVLDKANAVEVRADVVMEGANMASDAGAREVLQQRGVTIVPDFIGNAGGIVAAAFAMDSRNSPFVVDPDTVYDAVRSKLEGNTHALLEAQVRMGASPHDTALAMAQERVRDAMEVRGQWPVEDNMKDAS